MTTTTDTRDRAVITNCDAIAAVIDSAHRFGLAMPHTVAATSYGTLLHLFGADNWREWAEYLSADGDPITAYVREYQLTDQLILRGVAHDFPVEVVTIVPAGEGAAHVAAVTA